MINTVDIYLNRIPSENQGQPNFMATLEAALSVMVQIQNVINSMIPLFDLSLAPVGDQLDIIGIWVGAPRQINNPFAGVFFTWDDVASDGWDFGIWQQAGSPSAITVLPDDIYLTLIQAKIAINSWDGTTDGIYRLWAQVLPQYNILIQDNQDMSFDVIIQGTVPDSLTKALIVGGYLVPKPEGIRIAEYYLPVDTNPIFAWDCDSPGLNGWDVSSWASVVTPT